VREKYELAVGMVIADNLYGGVSIITNYKTRLLT